MFSPQESGSDFASIVYSPERLGPWHKLGNDEIPAQLHAKFWGKSMVDEEQEWRSAQSPVPAIGGELEDERQDGDELMDEPRDERMDDGERTDLDDDILPGCYVLDIGIAGLGFPKIWIRAEYKRIYYFLEGYYHTIANRSSLAPGAVLTGQPGIG
jgi:hypothetical protein